MTKITNQSEQYAQLVGHLKTIYNLADVPDQLFKYRFDHLIFLDRDDVLSRSDKFFFCMKRFLNRIGERRFYLGVMDKFIYDNLFNLSNEVRDKIPFFEFDILSDDLSTWYLALGWDELQGIQYYTDTYWLPLIFGENNNWAIFLKKGEDFGVFGFNDELESAFKSSFQLKDVNGFKNFNELIFWLSQIMKGDILENYIRKMNANYYTDYEYT